MRRNQVALNKRAHPEFIVDLQVNLNPMTQTPCLLKRSKKSKLLISKYHTEESSSSENNIQKNKQQKNVEKSHSLKQQRNQKFQRKSLISADESSFSSSLSFVQDILIDQNHVQQNSVQTQDLKQKLINQLIIQKQKSLGQTGQIWIENQLQRQGLSNFTPQQSLFNSLRDIENSLPELNFSHSSSSSHDDFWQEKKQFQKIKTTIQLSSHLLKNKNGTIYLKQSATPKNVLKIPLSESIPEQECEQSLSVQNSLKQNLFQSNHIVKEEESKEENQSPDGSDCGCRPSILIVDDIPFNILPVRHMLNEFTKYIDEATNGQIAVNMFKQALEKSCGCQNRVYRLIFMDLQMPVKDGIQASKEIMDLQMSLPISDWCRIVVLTSYTNEKTMKECLQIGCSQVINKPVDHSKIVEVVNNHFFRL